MFIIKFEESNIKKIIRIFYKIFCSILVLVNIFFFNKNKKINIFYGGAYAGSFGGTLVKIQRLNNFFSCTASVAVSKSRTMNSMVAFS